jgi:hypothetical protein
MKVIIEWRFIRGDSDPLWKVERGLYAYIRDDSKEILYIGKVDGTTVRQRWQRKPDLWNYVEKELGIHKHAVIVGDIILDPNQRLTRELLADIESLLINQLRPSGNIQSRHSRISRPGLVVSFTGEWPLGKKRFFDDGV